MAFWKVAYNFRSTLFLVLIPLLSIPLPIVLGTSEAACGFCIIVMAGYWVSECLPLAVTSFLPLILFPLMGIMPSSQVSVVYFKDFTWFFVGSLILAVGVEHSNLHRRIALSVLMLVGTSPQSLMFGFMFPTYFLSMWIPNTATAAMMIPIVNAVLVELGKKGTFDSNQEPDEMNTIANSRIDDEDNYSNDTLDELKLRVCEVTMFTKHDALAIENESGEKTVTVDDDLTKCSKIESTTKQVEKQRDTTKIPTLVEKGLTICVPYAASIGGITTLTGTGPNIVLAGQYPILYPDAEPKINYSNWMAYHLPISVLMLGLSYLWLMWLYIGIKCDCSREEPERDHRVREVLETEYKKLGKIKWNEVIIIIILIATVLLWFFREPGFMTGWSVLFQEDFVTDGTVSMTMGCLLFILPSRRPNLLTKTPFDHRNIRPVPAVLTWKALNDLMPWNVVFLIGGGFALTEGATQSGFSDWLANQLIGLEGIPAWVVCLVVTVITCLFTECTSNVATASLFIPIISQLAQVLEVHPLYFLLPTIVATSLAFMLPVATPPNAIAFSYGFLKVMDLVKSGWVLNVIGVVLLMIFINSYANVIYQVNEFPEWASENYTAG